MDHDLDKAARADTMIVNDDPHDWYAPHPFYPDDGIPQVYDGGRGEVLLKKVEYSTTECSNCGTEARKEPSGLPVCPNCGLICGEPDEQLYEMVADPKSAGRVDNDGDFIQ